MTLGAGWTICGVDDIVGVYGGVIIFALGGVGMLVGLVNSLFLVYSPKRLFDCDWTLRGPYTTNDVQSIRIQLWFRIVGVVSSIGFTILLVRIVSAALRLLATL